MGMEVGAIRHAVSTGDSLYDSKVDVIVEDCRFTASARALTKSPVFAAVGKRRAETLLPGAGAVYAPMPGRVVSIEVRAGETVQVGQALLILEAMKMENEITAFCTGAVRHIHTSEGTNVNKNDLLVTLA